MNTSTAFVRQMSVKTAVFALLSLSATLATAPEHLPVAAAIGIDCSLERRRQSLRRCFRAKDTSRRRRSARGRHSGFQLQQLAKSSGNRYHHSEGEQPAQYIHVLHRPGVKGLTAALGVLSDGLVLIGNLPTADGTSATVQPGQLSVLNRNGPFLGTFGTQATVDGPWGMAVVDAGNGVSGTAHVFLSNVLSGVVSRFDIIYNATQISATALVLAEGFNHRLDPAALVLGPSGLTYELANDTLYVASSADNAIYQIPTATAPHGPVSATLFFQDFTHLHGPLNLAMLPNGHFLVANSDGSNADPNQPSELVEYSATGQFLAQMPLDPNNGGAFGLAVSTLAPDLTSPGRRR